MPVTGDLAFYPPTPDAKMYDVRVFGLTSAVNFAIWRGRVTAMPVEPTDDQRERSNYGGGYYPLKDRMVYPSGDWVFGGEGPYESIYFESDGAMEVSVVVEYRIR